MPIMKTVTIGGNTYTIEDGGAQRTLVSGTNIKTINNESLLGSGNITLSSTDEKLKWTASTSTGTFYPLQSTSSATTSTANTVNGINIYQYYNTAGGYRRLNLGNATAYKSSGGAYGAIRLYGTGATYYGDLNPGTIGTNSLTGNRTWTLPDKTGTIALTSDITDTKNTAGSTNSDSKLYLIGATEQSANPQTYSNSNLYFYNGLNSTVNGINNVFTEITQTTSTIGFRVSDETTFGYGIEASTSEVRMAATESLSGYVAVDDNGVWITGLVTPSTDYDAANKKYVDDVGSSILEITHIVGSGGTGAGNTWNYRKWSDGTLECWARLYVDSMNISSTTGQLKYGNVSLTTSQRTYPVAFTEYPTVTVSGNVSGANGWVVMNNTDYSKTQIGTMVAYSSASRTGVGVTVNVYAIGKWK